MSLNLRKTHKNVRTAKTFSVKEKRLLISYINDTLSQSISVDELAEVVGLERHQFVLAFRLAFGTTPKQFVLSQRISRAAWLLLHTDDDLARIALSVGFATHSHFSSSFLRAMGASPSLFRRRRNLSSHEHREQELAGLVSVPFHAYAGSKAEAYDKSPGAHAFLYALRHDELNLHYQPQILLDDQGKFKLRGVEALLRWETLALGSIPPEQLVAQAEEIGVIDELSNWVLRRACAQLADWRRRGLGISRISVNLSTHNFHNAKLPEEVAHALDEYRLEPGCLTLEVTERVPLVMVPETIAVIGQLKKMGVHLSIDDFGAGSAGFKYLRLFPFEEIKLDRDLINDLEISLIARKVMAAILRMGEELGRVVVAEGVETAAQCSILMAERCRVMQGYYFSRPLSAADLERWLSDDGVNRSIREISDVVPQMGWREGAT